MASFTQLPVNTKEYIPSSTSEWHMEGKGQNIPPVHTWAGNAENRWDWGLLGAVVWIQVSK